MVPVTFILPSLLDSIRSDIASGSDSLIKPGASAKERGLQGTVGTGKPGPARLEPTSATPPPTGACPPRPPQVAVLREGCPFVLNNRAAVEEACGVLSVPTLAWHLQMPSWSRQLLCLQKRQG